MEQWPVRYRHRPPGSAGQASSAQASCSGRCCGRRGGRGARAASQNFWAREKVGRSSWERMGGDGRRGCVTSRAAGADTQLPSPCVPPTIGPSRRPSLSGSGGGCGSQSAAEGGEQASGAAVWRVRRRRSRKSRRLAYLCFGCIGLEVILVSIIIKD